jgi:hypothetical protein
MPSQDVNASGVGSKPNLTSRSFVKVNFDVLLGYCGL